MLAESDLFPLSLGAALLRDRRRRQSLHRHAAVARIACARARRVEVLPLEAIGDDDYVGSVGGIGAPVVGIEKIKQGQECLRALRGVEEAAGVRVSALISAEIGGSNSIEPVLTAAYAGLPVLDGDGMGRAFPEVQMSTFFIYGLDPSPGAIADDKGNVVVFKTVVDMYLAGALRPPHRRRHGRGRGLRDDADARAPTSRRSPSRARLTQALEVGRTILDARARRHECGRAASSRKPARRCFSPARSRMCGANCAAASRSAKRGSSGLGDHAGSEARIAIQNENLVLFVDGEPGRRVPISS